MSDSVKECLYNLKYTIEENLSLLKDTSIKTKTAYSEKFFEGFDNELEYVEKLLNAYGEASRDREEIVDNLIANMVVNKNPSITLSSIKSTLGENFLSLSGLVGQYDNTPLEEVETNNKEFLVAVMENLNTIVNNTLENLDREEYVEDLNITTSAENNFFSKVQDIVYNKYVASAESLYDLRNANSSIEDVKDKWTSYKDLYNKDKERYDNTVDKLCTVLKYYTNRVNNWVI